MCDAAPRRGALVCNATSDGVGLGKLYPEQLGLPRGIAVEILDQKGPGFSPQFRMQDNELEQDINEASLPSRLNQCRQAFIQRGESIEIRGRVKTKIVFHGCRHYCKLPQIAVERSLVIFEIQIVITCAVINEHDVAGSAVDFVPIRDQAPIVIASHGVFGCQHRTIGGYRGREKAHQAVRGFACSRRARTCLRHPPMEMRCERRTDAAFEKCGL